MTQHAPTLEVEPPTRAITGAVQQNALVLVWSQSEPNRIGEIITLPRRPSQSRLLLGRDPGGCEVGEFFGELKRQRPGGNIVTGPLADPMVSRRHLLISAETDDSYVVENLGRVPCYVNGRQCGKTALIRLGDILRLGERLIFLVSRRLLELESLDAFPSDQMPSFGAPDAFGITGESPASWKLRSDIAFIARRNQHALVLGPSGTGKELAAQAIHLLSARGPKRLVARNAATIPTGLVAAELFGNSRNYPSAGLPERLGLIGAADGGTLMLDEIAELPEEAQANLLRVLDSHGEYQRLGETQRRTSDFRLIAATNRPLSYLKSDLRARFPLTLKIPGLNERRDDIAIISRYLLERIAVSDPEIGERLFPTTTESISNRLPVAPRFMERLLQHNYSLHVRELESILWAAINSKHGDCLDLNPEVEEALASGESAPEPVAPVVTTSLATSENPSPEAILAAIARNRGNKSKAAKELGLSSRYVLYRLLKTYGIDG